MSRDSLYGETIEWSGRPRDASVSPAGRVLIAVSAVFALVALSFAVVLSTALHASVSGLVVFAAWCSGVGLFTYCWPRFWSARVEYLITDRHVIWRRGPIRRSIERDSVSYALIRWNPRAAGTGDLVLVRAVPTGALRRTLSLTLSDVVAPDRIWALVRGSPPARRSATASGRSRSASTRGNGSSGAASAPRPLDVPAPRDPRPRARDRPRRRAVRGSRRADPPPPRAPSRAPRLELCRLRRGRRGVRPAPGRRRGGGWGTSPAGVRAALPGRPVTS